MTTFQRLLSLTVFHLVLVSSISSQTVGGDFGSIYRWQGSTPNSEFGSSVSFAGDVNADGFDDIIIGIPGAHPSHLSSGGAMEVRSGYDGSRLMAIDGSGDSKFGTSVSYAGDVNGDGFDDVIVGAPSNHIAAAPGKALVYSGADGSVLHWLTSPTSTTYGFGQSVSCAGDVDSDGFDDLLVGDIGSSDVYVFSGATGSILLQWSSSGSGNWLGYSVSRAGDVDQDGYDDFIVGMPGWGWGALDLAGSVCVYSGRYGALIHQWFGVSYNERFGRSVSGAGDLNGDGYPDLIVGAPLTNPGGQSYAGSAYVFSGFDGTLMYQWDGTTASESLGQSVAGAGDVNHDGVNDLIVGAMGANPGGLLGAGSVHIYSGVDGTLLHQIDGQSSGAGFGASVSGPGDVNGDAVVDFIVGAPKHSFPGLNKTGSAAVISFNPILASNTGTVSAAAGGTLNLELNFPTAAGFDYYRVLISGTGTGPYSHGIDIPLTRDSLATATFFGYYPVPQHSNMQGTLDATGDATASFTVPAGLSSALIGKVYYFAAISQSIGSLPEYSSVAVSIEITP